MAHGPKALGVGVIGHGVFGCHSLERELATFDGVRVVAATAGAEWGASTHDGQEVTKGKQYAAELGAAFEPDWEAVVAHPEVDVVSLMTSPATRLRPACRALELGKYVILDKPLAATASDAQAIARAEAESPAWGFMLCGLQDRGVVRRLREVIAGGELGAIKAVRIHYAFTGGVFPGFKPSERYVRGTLGGEMTNIGSHALHTLFWLLSPVRARRVYARTRTQFYESYRAVGMEDWADMSLELEREDEAVTASVTVTRVPYTPPDEPFEVEVTGIKGYAQIRASELRVWPSGLRVTDAISRPEVLHQTIGAFVDAVRSRSRTAVTFADGARLGGILAAAYESAKQGHPVDI